MGFRKIFKKIEDKIIEEGERRGGIGARLDPRFVKFEESKVLNKSSSDGIKRPRRSWTEQEKDQVRNRQGGRCSKCGEIPPRWHYDHKDGDSSNNSMQNCQALCPNCHDVKTYDKD